jgi:hypothetical protein
MTQRTEANPPTPNEKDSATVLVLLGGTISATYKHCNVQSQHGTTEQEFRRILALYFHGKSIRDWCKDLGIPDATDPMDHRTENWAPANVYTQRRRHTYTRPGRQKGNQPMKATKLTLREARKQISQILASGQTVAIAKPYHSVRGFIVGVPPHNPWSSKEKRKALKEAKARFINAWKAAQS